MKLTEEIKDKIDTYFANISDEDLYNLSINKYGFPFSDEKKINNTSQKDFSTHVCDIESVTNILKDYLIPYTSELKDIFSFLSETTREYERYNLDNKERVYKGDINTISSLDAKYTTSENSKSKMAYAA